MDPAEPVLVLAPHLDDEVLGCFAFLGSATHVLYCGVEDRPYASHEERKVETRSVAESLGFGWELLGNEVNRYDVADLIAPFEDALNQHRPGTLLIPQPSSYNQDHRAVYAAAIVAARPHDENFQVPAVLVYEQPHTVMWPVGNAIEPSVFREIDITAKLAAYQMYASQVRGHRSPEVVAALARLRGAQIGRPHAEAFGVRRLVLPPASSED